VVLATSNILEESGLLGVLVAMFQERSGYQVRVVTNATGQAVTIAARGDADVALVHAPALEQRYVAEGKLRGRRLVMYDELVIVGPLNDPAGIRETATVPDAMRAIAARRATFVSRGDQSSTHVIERSLWDQARVHPSADWYIEAQQGMSGTLGLAGAWRAYTLADRVTYIASRRRMVLPVLVEGGRPLRKGYCVLEVNAAGAPHVDAVGGRALADFLVSDEAQDVIGTFGRATYGQALFVPAAGLPAVDFSDEG
jgi:tungstate transport system substrate-binding protein